MKQLFELVSIEENPTESGEYRVVFPDGQSGLYQYGAENDMWVNGDGDDWFLGEQAMYYRPVPASQLKEQEGVDISEVEHEREEMIYAFSRFRKMFEGRSWIMEGRGSYPYDDDRYKEEVRYLFDEFKEIEKNMWAAIKSKTYEYRNMVIEDYKRSIAPAPKEQPGGEAMAFAEFIAKGNYEYDYRSGKPTKWNEVEDPQHHDIDEGPEIYTTKELYELFIDKRNKNVATKGQKRV